MAQQLLLAAKGILKHSRMGTFPSAPIVSNEQEQVQNSWHTLFSCIGNAYFDLNMVESELDSLFAYQLPNGFLPYFISHKPLSKMESPVNSWEGINVGSPSGLGLYSKLAAPPIHGFYPMAYLQKPSK